MKGTWSRVLLVRLRNVLPLVASVVLAAAVALPFALRPGIPGLHHDWIWPATRAEFIHWFLIGQSSWMPDGFGGALGSPTVNVVLGAFAALAAMGASPHLILALFIIAWLSLAQLGIGALLKELYAEIAAPAAWLLGIAYAYGPVAFQKMAAGHLYFILAYALLPWFALYGWRACSDAPLRARNVIAAGLIAAVSSAQIQFLFFDAFVIAAIALARPGVLRNVVSAAGIWAIALLHNAALFFTVTGMEQSGLLVQHATVQWERDLSGSWLGLASLGGYLHYYRAALPRRLHGVYFDIRWFVVALAAAGAGAALVAGRYRRIVLAFAVIALVGLITAVGWNGPFEPALSTALHRVAYFTIFRELYHFMALYAFGVVVIAGCAFTWLRSRAQLVVAVACAVIAMPFFGYGLPRIVPNVPFATFAPACATTNLVALLPAAEPVAQAADRAQSGIDPARLLPADGVSGGQPVAGRWAIAQASHGNFRALQALGVGCVRWRNGVVSAVPQTFEPYTGARFGRFRARERRLRERTMRTVTLPHARALVSLEDPAYRSALDAALADSRVPAGANVPLSYSFAANNIKTMWVSGTLWSPIEPQLMSLATPPLLTQAPRIAYRFDLPRRRWHVLYVLADTRTVTLDGRAGKALANPGRTLYRWYRWRTPIGGAMTLRFRGAAALARVIASNDASWTPVLPAGRGTRISIASHPTSMWRITARLPIFAHAKRVVLARSFASGWRLSVDGKDLGMAHRVHGLFNGWLVPPRFSGGSLTLAYGPQRLSWWINGSATLLELLGLAYVLIQRPLPFWKRSHAHRFARKHV